MIGGPGATVEIDETFIGGIKGIKAGGRSPHGKAIVAIAVESNGRVRLARLPNTTRETLTEFVLSNVERGSEVHTDAWGGYNDVGRYDYRHVVTNMSSRTLSTPTSRCPTRTASPRCSSGGCSARTRAA
jgi:hypothetical protein